MAKECLAYHLLPDIKKESPVTDIEKVRNIIFAALDKDGQDEKPRFVASGGRILALLPGQTLTTAEFSTGNEFNAQIRAFLAIPIIQKFIDLMGNNFMTSGARYKVPSSALQRADLAKTKLSINGLNERGDVLESYFNSDILFLFLASHNQRLIVE